MKFIPSCFKCKKSKSKSKDRIISKTCHSDEKEERKKMSLYRKRGKHLDNIKLPSWINLKCNALIYLKQSIINKREKEAIEEKYCEENPVEDIQENSEINNAKDLSNNEDEELQSSNDRTLPEECCDSLGIICPCCHLFIYKGITASCGHLFCQVCLEEYQLFKETCPICEKKIRGKKTRRCVIIDNSIEQIMQLSSKENYNQWLKKKRDEDLDLKKKAIPFKTVESVLEADENDLIIDVRDKEYIWCKARIMGVLEEKNKPNSIIIHYLDWYKKFDETIPLNSHRIARVGYYTDRNDIPSYIPGEKKNKKYIKKFTADKSGIVESMKEELVEDNILIRYSDSEEIMTTEDLHKHLIHKSGYKISNSASQNRVLDQEMPALSVLPSNPFALLSGFAFSRRIADSISRLN